MLDDEMGIPDLFDRDGLYGADGADYVDNATRFAVFVRAALAAAGELGLRPDIIHCHDWQAALGPLYARTGTEPGPPPVLLTVHNLAYQGVFSHAMVADAGLPEDDAAAEALAYGPDVGFLKGGILTADRVTTVSPTYAREICSPELGYGLDGLLRHRSEHLFGVLNGIDAQLWDPAIDPNIAAHFDTGDLAPKLENKRAVQQAMGLEIDDQALLFGHIGRLVEQKGVDLIIDGGTGGIDPTTVIDLSHGRIEILREGKGDTTAFR